MAQPLPRYERLRRTLAAAQDYRAEVLAWLPYEDYPQLRHDIEHAIEVLRREYQTALDERRASGPNN